MVYLGAALIGLACTALGPSQPRSIIATVALVLGVRWTVQGII